MNRIDAAIGWMLAAVDQTLFLKAVDDARDTRWTCGQGARNLSLADASSSCGGDDLQYPPLPVVIAMFGGTNPFQLRGDR
nr:hypothetical protein [Brevundimonas pondensis]